MIISLSAAQKSLEGVIPLPSSKSESNRALIIQALSREPIELSNLAEARDTQTMMRLLESEGHVLDVIDAGTVMRFLTGYFAAVGRDQILTGTPRMCKRPIGILVEALRELGANIDYWKQEGFPPLHIISKGSQMQGGEVSIPGNVSSQFISSILMIAPTLPEGVRLTLTESISSKPYIDMTRKLMERFGIETKWEGQTIVVPNQPYQGGAYTIEGDWSAASYWYSMVALADQAELTIKHLRPDSLQGDHKIASLMESFGVKTTFEDTGIKLEKVPFSKPAHPIQIDFSDVPDLAQTVAVVAAGLGVPVNMTGLHTLRIKETDRIEAIKTELSRFGVTVTITGDDCLITGQIQDTGATVHTYDDHRMAMAFAPLVLRLPTLTIEDPEVVQKSYPSFWKHLELIGIRGQEF